MPCEEAVLKILLGRNLISLMDGESYSGFFPSKLQKMRYLLTLLAGFQIAEINIEADVSLNENFFSFMIGDYCFYSGSIDKLASPDIFLQSDKIAFDFAEHLRSQLVRLFTREVFEKWLDNSYFYNNTKALDTDIVYEKALKVLASGGSLNERDLDKFDSSADSAFPSIPDDLLKALLLQGEGRLSDAMKLLIELSERDALSWIVFHFIGESFLYQGKREEALACFKKCHEAVTYYKDVLYSAALNSFENGDPYLCNQLIACGLSLYPKNTMLEFFHALLLTATGRRSRGIKLMNNLSSRSDIYPGALVAFAEMPEAKETALELILKALKLNPEHFEARIFYGELLFSYGEYNEALEYVNQLLDKDDNKAASYILRARIYAELDMILEAENDFRRASLLDSDYIYPLLEFYMNIGEYEKALPLTDEVLKNEPFNIGANEYRAFFAVGAGDHELAAAIYSKLNFIVPDRLDYMLALSDAYFKTGREEEGGKILIRARRSHGSNEHVQERAGWYYLERGKVKKAEEIFDEYLDGGGNENLLILYGKAVVLYKRKEYEASESICERCLSVSQDCDSALYMLSQIAFKRGCSLTALEYIEKALKLVPDSKIYNEFKEKLTENDL